MNRPRKEKTFLAEYDTDIPSKYMFALSKDIMDAILQDGAIATPFGVLIIEGKQKNAPSAHLSKLYKKVIFIDNSDTDGYRFTVSYKPDWKHYIRYKNKNRKRYTLKFKAYDTFKKKITQAVKNGLWLNWYKDDRK